MRRVWLTYFPSSEVVSHSILELMPEITPTLIDDLAGRTGRPVSECKKALMEADGNIGKAIDWFRSRGTFPIRRDAAEGRVAVMECDDGHCGALVEINCNSEAAAKSAPVVKLAATAARLLLRHPDVDITQAGNANLNIDEVGQQTGENVRVGRTAFLRNKEGRVGIFNHAEGKIGVLVSISGKIGEELLKDLCMQVAGGVREKDLLGQEFIRDASKTVGEVLKECGCRLVEFVRVEVGK